VRRQRRDAGTPGLLVLLGDEVLRQLVDAPGEMVDVRVPVGLPDRADGVCGHLARSSNKVEVAARGEQLDDDMRC